MVWGGMQIRQEMLPVSMERMELDKTPRTWGQGRWSWAGDGHGTASQCPLSLEQYPPWELPAAPFLSHSTGRETKEWGKPTHSPPPSSPKRLQENPWVPNRASPALLVTMGTRHQGRGAHVPQLGLCSPCSAESPSNALHSQGTAQGHRVAATTTTSTHWPGHRDHPAVPASKWHQSHQHSPVQTAVVSLLARRYPHNKDDG